MLSSAWWIRQMCRGQHPICEPWCWNMKPNICLNKISHLNSGKHTIIPYLSMRWHECEYGCKYTSTMVRRWHYTRALHAITMEVASEWISQASRRRQGKFFSTEPPGLPCEAPLGASALSRQPRVMLIDRMTSYACVCVLITSFITCISP